MPLFILLLFYSDLKQFITVNSFIDELLLKEIKSYKVLQIKMLINVLYVI